VAPPSSSLEAAGRDLASSREMRLKCLLVLKGSKLLHTQISDIAFSLPQTAVNYDASSINFMFAVFMYLISHDRVTILSAVGPVE
jgi:hypothetical protein